jgi:DNA-binding transcriptional MerR regulator
MSRPARPLEAKGHKTVKAASRVAPSAGRLKIGEAARLLGVEAYVLRFWETQFPALRPHHTASKHRLYDEQDVELLRQIKRLLYEEGFTIEGARKRLKELGIGRGQSGEPPADESKSEQVQNNAAPGAETRQALIDIRRDLESLYRMLKD